jgi:branched-chain amino acid transport system substrate-binding protein
VVLLAGGCTTSGGPASPPPLTIGVLAPLSGPDAARGQEAVQGVRLAVDVVNNPRLDLVLPYAATAGVRGGSKLALVVGDTRAEAGAPERMVRADGALGLVVADRAEPVRVVGERVERLAVPMIDVGSTDDTLGDLGRREYFRIVPTDRTLADAVFGLISQQRATGSAVRRVAVVGGSGAGSESVLAAFREATAAAGNDLSSLRYRDQPSDLDQVVSQLTAAGADLVVATATTDAEAQAAATLADRLRDRAPVIIMGSAAGGLAATGPGAGALRAVGWSARYAAKSPAATAVAELYRTMFGAAMTEAAATAFTATLALARAIDTADRPRATQVRAALRRVWFAGAETVMPWNGVRFDAAGQNELAAGLIEQRSQPGFQIVYPTELSAARAAWPAAKPSGHS